MRVALICPGLHPRVGVSRRERLADRLGLSHQSAQDVSRSRFPTRRSSRTTRRARRSSPPTPTVCDEGTAGLAGRQLLHRSPGRASAARIRQPALLMLAGQDRIVDNARTLAYFERLASTEREVIEYPEGHHTLEFDPDPSRLRSGSGRLARSSSSQRPADRMPEPWNRPNASCAS